MHNYQKLKVWRRAHDLNLAAHRRVRTFPYCHRSLAGQIRRAAGSVPANIVEGRYRRTDADFARFLDQSLGSLMELEYHLVFARDEGIIEVEEYSWFADQIEVVRRLLVGLIRRLRPP